MKEDDIKLMKRINEIYLEISVYGYRRITKQLKTNGFKVGQNKVYRLMKLMYISGPSLRLKRRKINLKKDKIKIYPYLLNDIDINRANQVWSRY